MEKHKQSVLEIAADVPKDSEKDDDGHTGEMVSILMLNDDVTPCGFVTFCLVKIDFGLTHKEAEKLMWYTHIFGESIVGRYPKKIAAKLLVDVARLNLRYGQSLRCKIQK